MDSEETFFIGELADRAGVSRGTIRYYERVSVLPEPERSDSGYRFYGPADVDRLEFVMQAKTLGLTLDEIAEILEVVDAGRAPCVHVRRALRSRLDETRERIRELRDLEDRMQRALDRAKRLESAGGDECRCRIIELRLRRQRSLRRFPTSRRA